MKAVLWVCVTTVTLFYSCTERQNGPLAGTCGNSALLPTWNWRLTQDNIFRGLHRTRTFRCYSDERSVPWLLWFAGGNHVFYKPWWHLHDGLLQLFIN